MRFLDSKRLSLLILITLITLCACHRQNTEALYQALPVNTAGNPNGDINLVEFYDPLCSDCRQMPRILQALIDKEPRLKVIYREIAIAEPFSETVIRSLLAAQLQDRYLAAQQVIMQGKAPTDDKTLLNLIKSAQVDPKVIEQDRQKDLVNQAFAENAKLAKTWQVQGTPTFFIGKDHHTPLRLEGTQTLDELLNAVNQAKGR